MVSNRVEFRFEIKQERRPKKFYVVQKWKRIIEKLYLHPQKIYVHAFAAAISAHVNAKARRIPLQKHSPVWLRLWYVCEISGRCFWATFPWNWWQFEGLDVSGSSAQMVIAVFVCFWSVRRSVGSICMGLEDDLEDTMRHFLESVPPRIFVFR